MIWGSRGSKSRLAKAAGAEPAGQMRDEKLHAVVARSTFASQNVQNVFSSCFFGRCFFFLITRAAPHQDPPTAKGQTPNGSANILIKIEMREYVLQHIHAQFLSFLKNFKDFLITFLPLFSPFFPFVTIRIFSGTKRIQSGYKDDKKVQKMQKKCQKMQKSAKTCKKVQNRPLDPAKPWFFIWKFPTCQGNMSPVPPSFSASALSAGPQLQALDRSVRRQTRTASTGSECSPPDLSCKRWIAVISAGPPPQAQDQIDPRRTSQAQDQIVPRWTRTASSGSEWSSPDLNCKC